MDKFTLIIDDSNKDVPLKQVIKREFHFSSRLMAKIKNQGLLYLNGVSVPGWVTANKGDTVSVRLPEERSNFVPEDIPLDIAYEDKDLLIINKQPFVTVHPTLGHPDHTIANGIMKYMNDTGQSFKIRFVNRLDRDTTGLLIVAKNSHSQNQLIKQMESKVITKEYKAIVSGIVEEDEFTIDLPIDRESPDSICRKVVKGGYPSITHVRVLERYENSTLVRIKLETGRTHQIRVHMSHIGHSLLGDALYLGPTDEFGERQALHSFYLSFIHPISREKIEVEAQLPEDMKKYVESHRK